MNLAIKNDLLPLEENEDGVALVEETDSYLLRRRNLADQVRERNLARFDGAGVKERLLARKAGLGKG